MMTLENMYLTYVKKRDASVNNWELYITGYRDSLDNAIRNYTTIIDRQEQEDLESAEQMRALVIFVIACTSVTVVSAVFSAALIKTIKNSAFNSVLAIAAKNGGNTIFNTSHWAYKRKDQITAVLGGVTQELADFIDIKKLLAESLLDTKVGDAAVQMGAVVSAVSEKNERLFRAAKIRLGMQASLNSQLAALNDVILEIKIKGEESEEAAIQAKKLIKATMKASPFMNNIPKMEAAGKSLDRMSLDMELLMWYQFMLTKDHLTYYHYFKKHRSHSYRMGSSTVTKYTKQNSSIDISPLDKKNYPKKYVVYRDDAIRFDSGTVNYDKIGSTIKDHIIKRTNQRFRGHFIFIEGGKYDNICKTTLEFAELLINQIRHEQKTKQVFGKY